MPNSIDPPVRVDNPYFQELEIYLARQLLDISAVMINAIGKGGTIYPNILLPPNEADRKAAMMAASQGGQ